MAAVYGQETMLYKKVDLPKNKDVSLTKDCLERILRHIGKQGEYGCPIDKDCNHWLFFDHGHNIIEITYSVFGGDVTMEDKNIVRVALTGNWKEDVIYGIKKALNENE